MDESRLTRIEKTLDRLVETHLARAEFDRRMDRLDSRIGHALDRIGRQDSRLGVTEKLLEQAGSAIDDLHERMNDVEDVAAAQVSKEKRRGWIIPTVVTSIGMAVNGAMSVITYIVSVGHGGH